MFVLASGAMTKLSWTSVSTAVTVNATVCATPPSVHDIVYVADEPDVARMGSMLNIPSRMEGPEQKTIIGKPEITVSAKGIQNGTSVYLNDGADFGPDTKLVASKMKEFQQMMPNLMNSILPVATSISEQLTTDLSDIKKALSVIYRKQLELEKAINALQRQGT